VIFYIVLFAVLAALRGPGHTPGQLLRRLFGRRPAPRPRPPAPALEFRADPADLEEGVRGWPTEQLTDVGVGLVRAFIEGDGPPLDPSRFARGLAMLELALSREASDDAGRAALWMLGLGYRRVGSFRRSADLFTDLRALVPDDDGVANEFVIAHLLLGRADDVLAVARDLVARRDDADARSNFALALLLADDVTGALAMAERAAAEAPDDRTIGKVLALVRDVQAGRRPRPASLRDLSARSTVAPTLGLEPDEAHQAFREAITAYRAMLQTQGGQVVPSAARARIEREIGPIAGVEIEIEDADLSWQGRSLSAQATERATFTGRRGGVAWTRAVRFAIEEREEGWRVMQVWSLPSIAPEGGDPAGDDADAGPGPFETVH
jgi:tetratricopeptide (TPR) repeat protein